MTESDCEIEYLDEDAEIVQQCVHTVSIPEQEVQEPSFEVEQKLPPLLVERRPGDKRKKRKRKEDDSDYDPNEDILPPSPPASPRNKKKKWQHMKKYGKSYQKVENDEEHLKILKKINQKQQLLVKEQPLNRKKCNIRIPDYDDPLCLPVKALKSQDSDMKKLENWNNVCLEHFKHCDTILKPEQGETKSSTRTLVLRNVANKQTNKIETTIWSKTSVENENGDKKSEIFQCVLPHYKEKKLLNSINLKSRKVKPFHLIDEAILTRENHKDGEVLVVYKPKEALSAVYKMFGRKSESNNDEDEKSFLREMSFNKVCAPCFQTSWRGVNKNEKKKTILCPICGRTYVTVYNLLAHFKLHSARDVNKCKKLISTALADIVSYHYKCRICQQKLSSIKSLRQHVTTHQGVELFKCEVGNHMAS